MKILSTLFLLVMITGIGIGQQRETVADFGKELKSAHWLKIGDDGDGFPISLNTARIEKINGVVIFRTKFEKRGTIVYDAHIGSCTTDRLADAPHGWAQYVGSSKIVDVGIIPVTGADENGMYTVTAESIGGIMLNYACTHPTSIKVLDIN